MQMTSSQKQTRKLKILCMHGYGTNKEFMKMQTQAFRRDFEDMAEFIFVDAPNIVPIKFITDPKVIKNLEAPPRSWADWRVVHKTKTNEESSQGLADVRKAIEEASDQYDGAMCFSQGSQVFQMILWAQQLKIIDWQLLKNLKFFINFSADSFRISLKNLNYTRFSIPSLHFLSEEDFLFKKCIINPTIYQNPQIIFHTFGHRFPLLGLKEKKKMKLFLRRHGFGENISNKIEEESRL